MTALARAFVALLAVCAGAFLIFNARQSQYSAASAEVLSSSQSSDLTIVLTGGSGRIEQGVALLSSGRTSHVFISGVGEGVRIEDLPQMAGLEDSQIACCITLGYEALDTIGNASEVAAWLKERAAKQAFLVTSRYHMPRALAELSALMPQARFITITVPSGAGERQQLREFGKYIAALIRLKMAGPAT